MTPFSIGDVVSLKSGGPRMTVENVDTKITCVWLADDGKLFREAFTSPTLKKYGADPTNSRGRGRERIEEVRG